MPDGHLALCDKFVTGDPHLEMEPVADTGGGRRIYRQVLRSRLETRVKVLDLDGRPIPDAERGGTIVDADDEPRHRCSTYREGGAECLFDILQVEPLLGPRRPPDGDGGLLQPQPRDDNAPGHQRPERRIDCDRSDGPLDV